MSSERFNYFPYRLPTIPGDYYYIEPPAEEPVPRVGRLLLSSKAAVTGVVSWFRYQWGRTGSSNRYLHPPSPRWDIEAAGWAPQASRETSHEYHGMWTISRRADRTNSSDEVELRGACPTYKKYRRPEYFKVVRGQLRPIRDLERLVAALPDVRYPRQPQPHDDEMTLELIRRGCTSPLEPVVTREQASCPPAAEIRAVMKAHRLRNSETRLDGDTEDLALWSNPHLSRQQIRENFREDARASRDSAYEFELLGGNYGKGPTRWRLFLNRRRWDPMPAIKTFVCMVLRIFWCVVACFPRSAQWRDWWQSIGAPSRVRRDMIYAKAATILHSGYASVSNITGFEIFQTIAVSVMSFLVEVIQQVLRLGGRPFF